jgi:hypothetical protein
MIKMKVSTKIDFSGLKKLQKDLKNNSVNVGYIDSKEHWVQEGQSVADVASHLHYWSAWNDTFMLSEDKQSQVQEIVNDLLPRLGRVPFESIARTIGKYGEQAIEENIVNVTSPSNSPEWAEIKGFNDPLIFGSGSGQEPNLISEITSKIGTV